MKRIAVMLVVVLTLHTAVVVSQQQQSPEDTNRKIAVQLFDSLKGRQKTQAVKAWEDKNRVVIRFATEGTGVPVTELDKQQQEWVEKLSRSLLSDFGLKHCQEMGGKGRVTFYGNPSDERFTFRIDKNNHLTLTYTDDGKEKGGSFGPIVLGAKGAGEATVWVEEDKLAVELAALVKNEAKTLQGKGLLLEELNEKARKVAGSLLEQRLAVLSPMARRVLDKAIQRDGGVNKVRLRMDGDASKSIDEGGRYSWSLTSPSFACDWKSDGKSHPHMTLTAKRGE